jgi:hypothetical protein
LAIQHAALEFGLEPHKVRWCTETAFQQATVRVPPSSRHRGCPGCGRRIVASRPDEEPVSA